MSRAAKPRGLGSVDVPAPPDLRAAMLRTGSRDVLVLSYRPWSPVIPAALTSAEQRVLAGILAGQSNADIARLRRTSLRTVANQVASIFEKLGVTSRAELVSLLFGSDRRVSRQEG